MYNSKQIQEWDKKFLWHPFTQMQDWIDEEQLVINEGDGIYLYDIEGNKYIDGISSLWVNVHGHNKNELNQAVKEQLEKIAHSTMLGLSSETAVLLAKKLIEITPESLSRVFYSDSGSTAVEIALKIAYQYWQQSGHPEKNTFIKFTNAYHGDTIGSVSVGGMNLFHKIYSHLLFETIDTPYPDFFHYEGTLDKETYHAFCLEQLENHLKTNQDKAAGVIVEPLVQGASGMITMPEGFLTSISKLCKKYDVLLIADEVATGFGRTGTMFACERENINPDIMCMAKGISGGYLPLAATLTSETIFEAFLGAFDSKKTFFHGHSYTGNALGCAAAIKSIELFEEENVLHNINENSTLMKEAFTEFMDLPHVGDIRHIGTMAGIELVRNKEKKIYYDYSERIGHKVCMRARKYGLILRPLGDVIILMPPLCIKTEELKQLLKITLRCIKEITEEN